MKIAKNKTTTTTLALFLLLTIAFPTEAVKESSRPTGTKVSQVTARKGRTDNLASGYPDAKCKVARPIKTSKARGQ
jgi:hypothetical protein